MGQRKNADAGHACWLGIDLGGTKILAAVVNEKGLIVGQAKQSTQPSLGPDGVIQRIVETATLALEASGACAETVRAAGIGAPAPADVETGMVYHPPNLPGWTEVALGPRLQDALGIPFFVDNDVNAGTLGEYMLGAGQGTKHMVGVFVGTGVGGGVIVDGDLHRGFRYSAGEVGHMIVVPNGPLCGCGRRGCLEAVASRTAIEREVRAGVATGRQSLAGDLLAASKRGRLTSGIIAKAVAAQDELMVEVLTQVQFYLALLVANIVNFFDPEMIVFGGGVVEALGDDFLEPIRTRARPYFIQQREADRVRIVPAVLGDQAGVLGAAMLGRQQVKHHS